MVMKSKRYIPLRDKLILNFVTIGVVIIIVIGYFSYYTARKVLLERIFDQLTSVRVVKKRQIESFFADRTRDIKLIVDSEDARDILDITMTKNTEIDEETNKISSIYSRYLLKYLSSRNYYKTFILESDNGISLTIPINGDSMKILESSDIIHDSLWNRIRETSEIVIVDLDKNRVNTGLFIAAPIIEENSMTGMIVMEISMDAINKIMYENNPYEGLGESGESYLVGQDMLMRSNSRFQDNSILQTKVETPAVLQALRGTDSTAIINDYRGIKVLSSFSPVYINDLHWVILAEIDLKEALVPLDAIRNNIILISSFIVLMLFLAAVFFADRITSPLRKLINATKQIGEGNFNTELKSELKNEIGDLMDSFNFMASKLDEKTTELKLERIKRLRSVIDGQEYERQRLSRELHDGLGQRLIALKLALESIKTEYKESTTPTISEIQNSFDETIDDIRRMSNNLLPAVLYEFGIETALRNLVEDIPEQYNVKGIFSTKGTFKVPDKTTKTYLYRIAQEAVNNVLKHAKAKTVKVEFNKMVDKLELIIEDDGCGFEEDHDVTRTGNGLFNMKERTGLLNGEIIIESKGHCGTKIIVHIPNKKQLKEND